MELWLIERHTDRLSLNVKVEKTVYREKTRYQDLAIVDTYEFGRALILDGVIQTTERDEFIYHEMLAHVPLHVHTNPERVLVIGGGDGGTIREVLRHPTVKEAHLVEIDEAVVRACTTYMPSISCALSDPRVRVIIDDGVEFVKDKAGEYDAVLVDSTDPSGPSLGLFNVEFYSNVARVLRDGGVFAAQTEQPFFEPDLVRRIFHMISQAFPVARPYLATIPTYSSWSWCFTFASKGEHAENVMPTRCTGLRYYSREVHLASFALPPFMHHLFEQDVATG